MGCWGVRNIPVEPKVTLTNYLKDYVSLSAGELFLSLLIAAKVAIAAKQNHILEATRADQIWRIVLLAKLMYSQRAQIILFFRQVS